MPWTILHKWPKFSDYWLKTSTCIAENVLFLLKHEYRRLTLTSHCDVINDVIQIQTIAFYIFWDVESKSGIRLKLSWKLTKIENQNFHVRNSTSGAFLNWTRHLKLIMSARCALISTTFQFFKFCCSSKIDWLMRIFHFRQLLGLMTSSMTSSTPNTIHLGVVPDYICWRSLVMIGWKLWPVSLF